MSKSVFRRGAFLLLAAVLLVGATTGVAVAEPTVSVSVDGQGVSEGETVQTGGDPTVDVEASADSPIELVEIRVNGEVRETYEPGSTSVSESTTLDLDNGEQTLRVIVNAEETTTFEATVLRDGAAPLIEYTNPLRTPSMGSPPDSTTVGDAEVTLSANLRDDTGVETIEIRRTFTYSFGGSSEQSVASHTIESPGDDFEQELFLGDGENDLRIRYVDEMGNVRVHEFTLVVDDSELPTIELSAPQRTGAPQVRIRGEVTDNVKLQTVTVERPDGTSFQPITERSPEPDRDRLAIEINEEISLSEGENEFAVRATDNAGNTASESITVVYDRQVAPRVTFDADGTGFEDGTLRVQGRVDRGEITRVGIESVDPDSGDVIDITSVYDGDATTRVDIDETLGVGDGEARIRVIITDAAGNQHEETFTADADAGTTSLGGGAPSTDTPEPEDEPTPTAVADTATPTGTAAGGDSGSGGGNGGDSGGTPAGTDSGGDGDDGIGGDIPTTDGFTVVVAVVALALFAVMAAVRE